MNNVCVLGSINMDMVLNIRDIPLVGETILSKNFTKIPGGKGANQAVAAQRLGAKVYMIGKLGRDENGKTLYGAMKKDGINLEHVIYDEENPTGMAIILVNEQGNNSIVVVSGANMKLTKDDVLGAAQVIKDSKFIVAQFETPMEVTLEAFKIAKGNDVITILNPAPASEMPKSILPLTDIIIPNETEIQKLTGIQVFDGESAKKAAEVLLNSGVRFVIITLGEKGAALVSKDKWEIIPAYKVKAIDTTAAGDGFIGALVSSLEFEDGNEYASIKRAIEYGNKVSSIVVQRKGAQTSLPFLKELEST